MASLNQLIQRTSSLGLKTPVLRTVVCGCQSREHSSGSPSSANNHNVSPTRKKNKIAKELLQRSGSRLYSNEGPNAKFLFQSTMLIQDGTEIEELPVLIRKASQNSFPFSSHTYNGEHMSQLESSETTSFRQMLQDCESVQDVFRLLEAPSDRLDGFSAAFALERLHVLRHLNQDWKEIHSFIRSSLMGLLYGTVRRDVHLLPNTMLVSLVNCYLGAGSFPLSCVEAVNKEIQVRLGDGAFSVPDLLALSNILEIKNIQKPTQQSESVQPSSAVDQMYQERSKWMQPLSCEKSLEEKNLHFDRFSSMVTSEYKATVKSQCSEIHTNIWAHLGLRYMEVDPDSLPSMLQSLSRDSRGLMNLLEQRFQDIWLDLSPAGVCQCLEGLSRLRHYRPVAMGLLARWAYVNVHLVSHDMLLSFLTTFLQFCYLDKNLIRVVERCLTKGGNAAQTDAFAMGVEYCRANNYLSPLILDAAASHFSRHHQSYSPLEAFTVLRAFGHLNYLPSQPSIFTASVEQYLQSHLEAIEPDQLLEVLGSLTFLGLMPTAFYTSIKTDHFYSTVAALSPTRKYRAMAWLRVVRHACSQHLHQDLDKQMGWVTKWDSARSLFSRLDYPLLAVHVLKEALVESVGPEHFHVIPFYGCRAMYLDDKGVPLRLVPSPHTRRTEPEGKVHTKLALLLRSADHFTVNTGQLLGPQYSRKAQLQELGFVTVELRTRQLLNVQRGDYLRSQLSPFVNFEAIDWLDPTLTLDDPSAALLEEEEENEAILWEEGEEEEDLVLPSLKSGKREEFENGGDSES